MFSVFYWKILQHVLLAKAKQRLTKYCDRTRLSHLRWPYVIKYPPDVSIGGGFWSEQVLTGLQWWPHMSPAAGSCTVKFNASWVMVTWDPHPCEQTDTSENSTFLHLRWLPVKIQSVIFPFRNGKRRKRRRSKEKNIWNLGANLVMIWNVTIWRWERTVQKGKAVY